MEGQISVTLTQGEGYRFDIDFGEGRPLLTADEPPPLGEGAGPAPNHLLAAAVGNCLSASLHFAMSKYKQDHGGMRTTSAARVGRNERGRLRIVGIDVEIHFGVNADALQHLERILDQFEDFCTVSMSVAPAIPLTVSVFDAAGRKLK
ncbi:MAG: OsmC family protein [Burkholderiaceae bacterium]